MAPSSGSSRAAALRDGAILAAAILLCFGPLLWAPFIYDDVRFIVRGAFVSGPWPGLWTLLSRPADATGAWEPLATLEHRFLFALFGARVWPYRLSSLLLHWADAGLLLTIARRRVGRPWALAAALLFALFPAHVETLALSTFKTHLTASLAALACLALLESPRWDSRGRTLSCWLLFAAGLLAKETAVVIPLLAAASLASRQPRPEPRRAAPLFVGWAVLGLLYAALRVTLARRPLEAAVGGSPLLQALTAAKLWLWYLAHLFVPAGLCLEHSLRAVEGVSPAAAGLAAGALAALAGLAALARLDRDAAFGAAWVAAALLPFLDLVPFLNFSLVSDRYLYLAGAGAALLAAALARRFAPERLALGFLTAAAACGAFDLRRAALFSDPLELWTETAACAPGNPRAHAALGAYLFDRRLYGDAAAEFERAVALKPDYWEAVSDLAMTQAALGSGDAALALARRRAAGRPDSDGFLVLGSVFLEQGRARDALGPLELAVRLDPSNDQARLRLGQAALSLRRWDEAERELTRAEGSERQALEAREALAELAAARGDADGARTLYQEVLRADPLQGRAARALAELLARQGEREAALRVCDDLLARLDQATAAVRGSGARAEGLLRDAEKDRAEAAALRERLAVARPTRRRRS